jgi:hypothetical protein
MNVHSPLAAGEATQAARFATTSSPVLVPCTDRVAWDRLLARATFAHFPQDWAYAEGKVAGGKWGIRRYIIRHDDTERALVTVLEYRVMGIVVLSRINRGPVFLASEPSEDELADVLRLLRRTCRGLLLFAAPSITENQIADRVMPRAGFLRWQKFGWSSGRIDISRSEQEIFAEFASPFRNRVRVGLKSSAVVRASVDRAAYDWLVDRHVENMRNKDFKAFTPDQLQALREAAMPGNVTVFRVFIGERPVAGMSVVRFGDTAEYHIGWFGPDGRAVNAGNLLMWRIIQELRLLGVKSFDVGGMRPGDGYTRFKQGMRPTPYTLSGDWLGLGKLP